MAQVKVACFPKPAESAVRRLNISNLKLTCQHSLGEKSDAVQKSLWATLVGLLRRTIGKLTFAELGDDELVVKAARDAASEETWQTWARDRVLRRHQLLRGRWGRAAAADRAVRPGRFRDRAGVSPAPHRGTPRRCRGEAGEGRAVADRARRGRKIGAHRPTYDHISRTHLRSRFPGNQDYPGY